MATQRTKKLPRKLLSWGITAICIAAMVMVFIRYRQHPQGERIAAKEAKEQKTIEQDKPGDPAKLAATLARAADEALQQKAKEEQQRLAAARAQAANAQIATGDKAVGNNNLPDWSQVPGRQPNGSPMNVDQYEQAKQSAKHVAASTQQLVGNNKIVAWEADDGNTPNTAAQAGLTGNKQLDTVLEQLNQAAPAAGATTPNASPVTEAVDRIVTAQSQKDAKVGHANEEWLRSVADRKADSYAVAKPPLSPYTLYRDDWIPCALRGAMNSDMPGDMACQVTRDVYDTVTGTILLIPKFSILSGPYNSDIAVGQERLLIAFHRLRYPSGSTVELGAMSGADSNGQSGLSADVNTHFFSIFGASFLITGLAAAVSRNEASSGTSITINSTAANTFAGAAGQAMLETVKKILDRNSGIKPTLTKQGGVQILVYVNRDLILPPQVTLTHQ